LDAGVFLLWVGGLAFVDGVDLLFFHESLGVHEDVLDCFFVKVEVEGAGGLLACCEVDLLLLFGDGLDWAGFGVHGFADDFVDGEVFGVVGG
jgi:hypothetical protein